MGLLDDLEKESERRHQAEADAEQRIKNQRRLYRRDVEPAMDRLQAYLEKLVDHLNYLKPEIGEKYSIPGYGTVSGRFILPIEVVSETRRWERELKIAVPLKLDREASPEVELEGPSNVKSTIQRLQSLHLASNAKIKKDKNGQIQSATVQVDGRLRLTARISTSVEANGKILFEFRNFEDLSKRTRSFSLDQINDDLNDQMGRYITRKNNALMKEEISEEMRQALRKRIHQESMQRKWEHKLTQEMPAVSEEHEKAKKSSKGGLLGRLLGGKKS